MYMSRYIWVASRRRELKIQQNRQFFLRISSFRRAHFGRLVLRAPSVDSAHIWTVVRYRWGKTIFWVITDPTPCLRPHRSKWRSACDISNLWEDVWFLEYPRIFQKFLEYPRIFQKSKCHHPLGEAKVCLHNVWPKHSQRVRTMRWHEVLYSIQNGSFGNRFGSNFFWNTVERIPILEYCRIWNIVGCVPFCFGIL